MKRDLLARRACLGLLAGSALAGCAPMGPRSLQATRPAYNMAVAQTNDQELLLNLVRLRYRDTLYFTSVERIASTLEWNRGVVVGGSAGRTENTFGTQPAATTANAWIAEALTRNLNLGGASVQLNEKPTIFYAPIEGERFVRQMMTPMNPELLLLGINAGWTLERVFMVTVEQMNGLRNDPSIDDLKVRKEPGFRQFREALQMLTLLQRRHLIELAAAPEGGVQLRFLSAPEDDVATARVMDLLGLDRNRANFRIIPGGTQRRTDAISISTRPMIAALTYLSWGVDVPDVHQKAGKVRALSRDIETEDLREEMLSRIFEVLVSRESPRDASVVIPFRDHHYYIADNDVDTKATFLLITQIMALHSASSTQPPGLSFSFGR